MGLPAPREPEPAVREDLPDADLVRAVAEDRDREAFAVLFARYAGRVRGFLVAGGLAPNAADDLTQDILIEVWRRAERYDPTRASVATWIFTIARSRRIDTLRRERVFEVEPEEAAAGPSHELRIDHERAEQALHEALAALPPEQVVVLQHAYFAGKSMSEIAAEERLPVGTVKSRVRLAVERLRLVLGGGRS